MRRLLLCLPLCFVLAPDSSTPSSELAAERARPAGDGPLPDNRTMEKLARTDPIAFLENCLRRSDREVKGYHCVLRKQERIKGELQPTEVVDADFREKPFSVRMVWKEGIRRVRKTLYAEGENGGKIMVRPEGRIAGLLVVSLDPNGAEVKDSSRYPPTEFGMKIGAEKTLAAWKNAQKHGDLKVTFKGERRVKEAGDRLCWVLERTNYVRREEDGIARATFYFDKETWLQIGSVLRRADDHILGEYFFRDIQLNPEFDPDTFTRKGI
jgi:hypothetical protein